MCVGDSDMQDMSIRIWDVENWPGISVAKTLHHFRKLLLHFGVEH